MTSLGDIMKLLECGSLQFIKECGMGLRLFNLSKCLNYSINRILFNLDTIGSFIKFSTAGGAKNRIKVVKPDLSSEDDVYFTNEKAKENKRSDKKKRAALTVVTPFLDERITKELLNVVGLHVGPCSVFWAKIKRSGDVLDWSHRKLFPIADKSKRIQLPHLYEELSSMLEYIPVGDVYILEAANHIQPNSLQSSSASLSALLHAQILAMLVALLNCRVESDLISDTQEDFHRELDYIHKVYFLRPRMMSRLFRLLVGTERVSALDLVDSILDGSRVLKEDIADANEENSVNTEKAQLHPAPIFTPVYVPSNIASSYNRLRAVEKEEMCQALLVAMAFYDLVVFKDPKVLSHLQM